MDRQHFLHECTFDSSSPCFACLTCSQVVVVYQIKVARCDFEPMRYSPVASVCWREIRRLRDDCDDKRTNASSLCRRVQNHVRESFCCYRPILNLESYYSARNRIPGYQVVSPHQLAGISIKSITDEARKDGYLCLSIDRLFCVDG